jgi:hypothetical protein
MRPSGEILAPAGDMYAQTDSRIQAAIQDHFARNVGVARPRSLALSIPLAGATAPTAGWLTSLIIPGMRVRFAAWFISANVPGAISLDLQVSYIQTDMATLPPLASILNPPDITYDANPDIGWLQLNGYTIANYDTSGWYQRDLIGPFVLHVIINAVSGLGQAVLGLHLWDLQGKTLQQ